MLAANWPTLEALKAMTWMELARWHSVLETLRESFQYEMDNRATHISHIMSLSAADLEAYVRDKKPDWEFAKHELDALRAAGK